MTSGSHLSIWFFVGILLTFYGLIITGAGIYGLFVPAPVHLAQYHADLWWGLHPAGHRGLLLLSLRTAKSPGAVRASTGAAAGQGAGFSGRT